MKQFLTLSSLAITLLVLASCGPKRTPTPKPTRTRLSTSEQELDFEVENKTGKTIYAVCFSYIKENDFARWHWDKSAIHKIPPEKTIVINVDTIPDKVDRENVFGYLDIFNTRAQAEARRCR